MHCPFLKISERQLRHPVSSKDLLCTDCRFLIDPLPIANHQDFLPRAFLSHFLHLSESSSINVEKVEVYISQHSCQFLECVLFLEIELGLWCFLLLLLLIFREIALRCHLALPHMLVLQVVKIVVLRSFLRITGHFVHSLQIVINHVLLIMFVFFWVLQVSYGFIRANRASCLCLLIGDDQFEEKV